MASYYVWSGATGSANGTSWANAYTTLETAFTSKAAGDTFFVAHDHSQSSTGPNLIGPGSYDNPIKIVCVNRAGSVPPVSADRRNTAEVISTLANNLNIAGWSYYDGLIFRCGVGGTSSSANLVLFSANYQYLRFDNCSLRLENTSGGSVFFSGGGNNAGLITDLNNTTFSFASGSGASGAWLLHSGQFRWRNTPNALLGALPVGSGSNLFGHVTSARGVSVECIGVDLSAIGSGFALFNWGADQAARGTLIDCKTHPAVLKQRNSRGLSIQGIEAIDFYRSTPGGNVSIYGWRIAGDLSEELSIVRTSGGATDGITPIAWKVITANSSFCMWLYPYECPVIAVWNTKTGTPVTATVEGVWGGGAVPNNDDIWLDCEFLGASHGSFVNDSKTDLLATAAAQTASSAAWGGSTTKFKLECTFTPQQPGYIYARVKCAKPSSTFYIDPMVTLS